jgi:putative multiple sugar transport system substrate-binding protein
MQVLQSKIDAGTLIVGSYQTDFIQCAIIDWDNSKSQARTDVLLYGFYADKEIHGILSPNDGIARAITASEQAGQPIPVLSGLDAENVSVEWIWSGRQYATVAKPTAVLVGRTVEIIQALQEGQGMPTPDVYVNISRKDVGVYELPPLIATNANAKEAFSDDPIRLGLLKD